MQSFRLTASAILVSALVAACGGGGSSAPGPQTISFAAPSTQTMGVAAPALVATASSNLVVTLTSSTPTVCTVSGTTLTLVSAGTCTIAANQAGNSSFVAASAVTVSFTVNVAGTIVAIAKMNDIDLNAILSAAKDGDTITLPAGKYTMRGPLQLAGKKNITIVGAGKGTDITTSTILTFKAALAQNGLSATGMDGLVLRKFAVEDAAGNGIFVGASKNVLMDTLRTEWTTDPHNTSTMVYGLYPVNSDNVKIMNSTAIGARDAGVYVGQSTNILVTGNDVNNNVAGVEIENSHNAIVEKNNVTKNTGGVLVFALTGPERFLDTLDVVVRDNTIVDNNLPPAANATGLVLTIPVGTGVMVLASNRVDVSKNTITNHKTNAVLIISADTAGIAQTTKKDAQGKPYDRYSRAVYVYNNTISNFGTSPGGPFADPAQLKPFVQGFFANLASGGQPQIFPAVLWDGIVDPATGTGIKANGSGGSYAAALKICSKGNVMTQPAGAAISYENLDLNIASLLAGAPEVVFPGAARMDCTLTLPAVTGSTGL